MLPYNDCIKSQEGVFSQLAARPGRILKIVSNPKRESFHNVTPCSALITTIVSNPKRESFHNNQEIYFTNSSIVSNPKRESFHNGEVTIQKDLVIVSNPKRESFHNNNCGKCRRKSNCIKSQEGVFSQPSSLSVAALVYCIKSQEGVFSQHQVI